MSDALELCELCHRSGLPLTRHHLIPKTRHSNKRNKREFSRDDVHHRIAMLCRPCHSTIHATFTERELERRLNTLEALREEAAIQTWIRFISGRPAGFRPQIRKRVKSG